jgi:hypothetical protein
MASGQPRSGRKPPYQSSSTNSLKEIVISLKMRFFGTIFLHCIINLQKAGCPAFDELKLFQKISDTPVSVFVRDDAFFFSILLSTGGSGPGKLRISI